LKVSTNKALWDLGYTEKTRLSTFTQFKCSVSGNPFACYSKQAQTSVWRADCELEGQQYWGIGIKGDVRL